MYLNFQEAPVGSVVFQALAIDPDDPATPNGRLTYKFLDEGILGTDHASFEIRNLISLSHLEKNLKIIHRFAFEIALKN